MTSKYKNLSAQEIENRCKHFKYDTAQYRTLVQRLQKLNFDLDHTHLILFKKDAILSLESLEKNIKNMIVNWRFTFEQIARITGMGGYEVLNTLILLATPLLSFGYTPSIIHKICISAHAIEKLNFLYYNHNYLIQSGLSISDIYHLIMQKPKSEFNHHPPSATGMMSNSPHRTSPAQSELESLTETPMTYGHEVLDEFDDRPTPYSHALTDDYSDRRTPFSPLFFASAQQSPVNAHSISAEELYRHLGEFSDDTELRLPFSA